MAPSTLHIGVFGVRGIPSTYSGYETFATVLLPELVRRGHRVTLYVRGGEREQPSFEGVRRIGLPTWKTKQFDTISHGIVAARAARKDPDIDVVLAFNVANAFMLAPLTRAGVPTVLNVDGQEWLRDKWGRVGKQVFFSSAAAAKRCATLLVSDCVAMQKIYLRRFDAESVPIPYCWTDMVDTTSTQSEDAEVLERHGLVDKSYVLTGGRMVPENNIHRIVASHCRSDLDADIVVLGTANYDSPVTRSINDAAAQDSRVKILGHISDRAEFGILLRNAAVYFHGHSVGGINPSIVEAMGVGAQICALETPFNREALDDAGTYFVDPDTAIQTAPPLVETPGTFDHLRDRAMSRVGELFSLELVADHYESVLRAAHEKAQSGRK